MRILIAGGSGFIGAHVLSELIETGERPVVFDICLDPSLAKKCGEDVVWIQGDIRNGDHVNAVAAEARPEVIVNLAGLLQYSCAQNPRKAVEINILGLSNLLEAAVSFGARRFVNASSIAAYGPFIREGKEDRPVSTDISLYGASKFFGETLCRQYMEKDRLEVTNLRYAGVYGPGNVRSSGVAMDLKELEGIVTGKDVALTDIHSDDHVHFVFVADAARATVSAAMIPGPLKPVYNIAGDSDSYVTFGQIYSILRSMSPNPGRAVFLGKGRDRGPLNIEAARADLKFVPRFSLLQGLSETVGSLLEGK